jgi:mersacidin/lichenicidin family type 2 lantibiotic
MRNIDIARAWKDEDYRLSLNPDEQASLPAHPAGDIVLTSAECALVAGGLPKNTDIPWACNYTTTRTGLCGGGLCGGG